MLCQHNWQPKWNNKFPEKQNTKSSLENTVLPTGNLNSPIYSLNITLAVKNVPTKKTPGSKDFGSNSNI